MTDQTFADALPTFETSYQTQPAELVSSVPVNNYDLIANIPVEVQVIVGSCQIPVHELMNLGRGSVIHLNKRIGDPVEIRIKNRLIAKGEIVQVDHEHGAGQYGVTLTEVMSRSGADT